MDYKIESCDRVHLGRNVASEREGLAREKKLELVRRSDVPEIRVDCDQGTESHRSSAIESYWKMR